MGTLTKHLVDSRTSFGCSMGDHRANSAIHLEHEETIFDDVDYHYNHTLK